MFLLSISLGSLVPAAMFGIEAITAGGHRVSTHPSFLKTLSALAGCCALVAVVVALALIAAAAVLTVKMASELSAPSPRSTLQHGSLSLRRYARLKRSHRFDSAA